MHSDTEWRPAARLAARSASASLKRRAPSKNLFDRCGKTVFGTVVAHHWDRSTGIALIPLPGDFLIHPAHQEHRFTLFNGVEVHEDIFVRSGTPKDQGDPPAVYYEVELHNDTSASVSRNVCLRVLRGDTEHDVCTVFDRQHNALVASNKSDRALVRASSPVRLRWPAGKSRWTMERRSPRIGRGFSATKRPLNVRPAWRAAPQPRFKAEPANGLFILCSPYR